MNQKLSEGLMKYQYLDNRIIRGYSHSEEFKERLNPLKKEISEIKKEIKNIQFKFIEILAIFVAVIGFLFGSIQFIPKFNFVETAGLLFILAVILVGFVLLIHWLFSKVSY